MLVSVLAIIITPEHCITLVCVPNLYKSKNYDADIMLSSAAYCVVAVESVGQQMPIAFLVRVKDDFSKRYAGGKAATAAPSSLNREFGYVCFCQC